MHKPLHCLGLTGSDVAGAALSTDGQQCDFVDRWMSQSTRDMTPHALVILNTGADDSIPRAERSTGPLCPTTSPYFLHYVVIFQHLKRDNGGILFLVLSWMLWVTIWRQNHHSKRLCIMCWVHIGHSQLWLDLAPRLLHVTAQAEPNLMACCITSCPLDRLDNRPPRASNNTLGTLRGHCVNQFHTPSQGAGNPFTITCTSTGAVRQFLRSHLLPRLKEDKLNGWIWMMEEMEILHKDYKKIKHPQNEMNAL